MNVYDEYLKLKQKYFSASNSQEKAQAKKQIEEANVFDRFKKQDFERMISEAGSARAKFEYTRMMKERFPD